MAVLTALTTNRRQERALAAQATRHRESLEAERERLELQLAHERRLRDLEELRARVDETATHLGALVDDVTRFQVLVRRCQAPQDPEALQRARQSQSQLSDGILRIMQMHHRLAVRFGWGSPIGDAVWATREAVVAVSDSVDLMQPVTEEAMAKFDDRFVEMAGAYRRFLDIAHATFVDRIPNT